MENGCATRLRTAVLLSAGPGQNAQCMSAKESNAEKRLNGGGINGQGLLPLCLLKATKSLTPEVSRTGVRSTQGTYKRSL